MNNNSDNMETKTITVEIPQGKRAEWVNGVLTLVNDTPIEPNERFNTFEKARGYLVKQELPVSPTCGEADISTLLKEANPKHIKALVAYNRLCTIAQAWNKADDFTPDFSNRNQTKWFPWFVYSDDAAGFVHAYSTATYAVANLGSRLCFKTSTRARQFGEQFIDLWNDVLLQKK